MNILPGISWKNWHNNSFQRTSYSRRWFQEWCWTVPHISRRSKWGNPWHCILPRSTVHTYRISIENRYKNRCWVALNCTWTVTTYSAGIDLWRNDHENSGTRLCLLRLWADDRLRWFISSLCVENRAESQPTYRGTSYCFDQMAQWLGMSAIRHRLSSSSLKRDSGLVWRIRTPPVSCEQNVVGPIAKWFFNCPPSLCKSCAQDSKHKGRANQSRNWANRNGKDSVCAASECFDSLG